ncbi:MAG TPA: putative sugar O-methyltransferase [Rhizomicrobium sp.]|nr:putative sugar O-methyltransferase [Rhizomicrobium sp.]
MTLRREILGGANRVLGKFGVQLLPYREYEMMRKSYEGPDWESPPAPPEAQAVLRWDNPDLAALEARYAGHPAAAHTQWGKGQLRSTIDLTRFRGDNHYVHQVRFNPGEAVYFMTAYYVRDIDRLGLFGTLKEDGLFGAYTVRFQDGSLISRDLLDSINQANMIARVLGTTSGWRVLDIGAGYGRLAHRLAEGVAGAHVTCTDAVALSTFLSRFYLKFRGVDDRADVVALDEAATTLPQQPFDIVTNIHSFPECPKAAIGWWLDRLDAIAVKKLLIVPNRADQFLSTEADGSHLDFMHLFEDHGWRHAHSEPIYAQSEVAQRCALYRHFKFHVFER